MAGSSRTNLTSQVGWCEKEPLKHIEEGERPESQLEMLSGSDEVRAESEFASRRANKRTWDSSSLKQHERESQSVPEDKSEKASYDLNPTEKCKHEFMIDSDRDSLRELLGHALVCIVQSFWDLVVKVNAGRTAESGWVKHILFTSGPCPCRPCIKSLKPESGWYEICVVTPQKVFEKTRGAWSADVEFSLSDGKTFTSTGMEIVREYKDGLCMFTSATHDKGLNELLERCRSSIFYGSDVPFIWPVDSTPSDKVSGEKMAVKVTHHDDKQEKIVKVYPDEKFEKDDDLAPWAPVLVLHF